MEILKGLMSTFKEILYDVFGYLLPGLFILLILSIPSMIGQRCSFMYALYEILFNSEVTFTINFLTSDKKISWIIILSILFIAYLLGHVSIYISSIIKPITNFTKKICTSQTDYSEFCDNILKILQQNSKFRHDLFTYTVKENGLDVKKNNNPKFISTFASTYSRFSSHNDLIQKYICKNNFYTSLSCIFFILFIDSIISYFIWKGLHPSINVYFLDFQIVLIVAFLFICHLTFFNQYNKHCQLKDKESFLFLYEYFDHL